MKVGQEGEEDKEKRRRGMDNGLMEGRKKGREENTPGSVCVSVLLSPLQSLITLHTVRPPTLRVCSGAIARAIRGLGEANLL